MVNQFPKFKNILNGKFLSFYLNQIHMPLTKMKKMDIDKFDVRRDFEQVLVIINYNDNEMKDLIHSTHPGSEKERMDHVQYNMRIEIQNMM